MPAVADARGRRLTFTDVQIIMAAVEPKKGLITDSEILSYIRGFDVSLAADLRESAKETDGSLTILKTARRMYGTLSAYTVLQGSTL